MMTNNQDKKGITISGMANVGKSAKKNYSIDNDHYQQILDSSSSSKVLFNAGNCGTNSSGEHN
jgi:hypothetical protein